MENENFDETVALIHRAACDEILGKSWTDKLYPEFYKQYMKDLSKFIQEERRTKVIYPKPENIFKAYELCPLDKVLVILCGQDVYHGENQAHGLSFSVLDEVKTPPSLMKIQRGIEQDCYEGLKLDKPNDLTYLAKQGVFLLNSVLTVEKGKPFSHAGKGWEEFTKKTLEILANNGNKLVFLSLGKEAQKITSFVDKDYHLVIEVEHPAAAAYNGREWNHENCFSRANKFLEENYNQKILW